jgi:hypothetical protein
MDDPHIERELVKTHDSAVDFYALNGESLVEFTEDKKRANLWCMRADSRQADSARFG